MKVGSFLLGIVAGLAFFAFLGCPPCKGWDASQREMFHKLEQQSHERWVVESVRRGRESQRLCKSLAAADAWLPSYRGTLYYRDMSMMYELCGARRYMPPEWKDLCEWWRKSADHRATGCGPSRVLRLPDGSILPWTCAEPWRHETQAGRLYQCW